MSYSLNIENEIIKIIEKYASNNESIRPESDFLFDLQFDSIRFIQLVVDLEEVFEIEFLDDYLVMDKMDTVEKLFSVVKDMIERKDSLNAE